MITQHACSGGEGWGAGRGAERERAEGGEEGVGGFGGRFEAPAVDFDRVGLDLRAFGHFFS